MVNTCRPQDELTIGAALISVEHILCHLLEDICLIAVFSSRLSPQLKCLLIDLTHHDL